ncbi:MAG: N-acetylmuramoyl-L-alanine amidase [Planctomycetes bacterium]|nr:N-acetylmuramoyl-L-alanine amidase [Planctomycetota bacterium]
MKLTPHRRRQLAAIAVACALLLLVRCAAGPGPAAAPRRGYSIVACGELFDIDTRVVLWDEAGGYDAYREGKFFGDEPPDGKRRYGERASHPETLEQLREHVHAFVLHFDVAGCSRQCFKVLQDLRVLSVHFMLDVDGTIYQTLDLRERAWHATIANDFGVGVEIAHPGAYAQPMNALMRRWYEKDEQGYYQKFPAWLQETGIRTEGFVARPARPDIIQGEIHDQIYYQLDYTAAQYEALAKLCAGLNRALPRIRLEAPRDAGGTVLTRKLEADELREFDGVIGHYHVQDNKSDPGPAMQWDRVLDDARAIVGER